MCAGDIAAGCGDRVVHRIDQPTTGPPLPRYCSGGDARAVLHFEVRRRGFDKAAVAAFGGAGVQHTAHGHGAGLHVAQQLDDAVVVVDRLGPDHAGVVDDGRKQVARCLRGHQHLAAVSLKQAAVLSQCVDRTLVDCDRE